mgnify:CR=1 FL=1
MFLKIVVAALPITSKGAWGVMLPIATLPPAYLMWDVDGTWVQKDAPIDASVVDNLKFVKSV